MRKTSFLIFNCVNVADCVSEDFLFMMSFNRLSNLRWKICAMRLSCSWADWFGSNTSCTSCQPAFAVKVMKRSEPPNLSHRASVFCKLCCMKQGSLVKLAGRTTFLPTKARSMPSWRASMTPLYSSVKSCFWCLWTQVRHECSAAVLRTLQVNSFICCTWPWVKTCDVSQILPYLHVTVSKCTWCYFGHFLYFHAHDREYILLYFDTITGLVMIG